MKFLLTLLLLCFAFKVSFSQEKLKAILIDEVPKTCSEDLMSRISNLTIAVRNSPNQKVYILLYGNEATEGRNLYFAEWLQNYLLKWIRLEKSQIEILRGANGKSEKTQFWLVPVGAEPPQLESNFVPPSFTDKTRFDLADGYINPYTKQIESSFHDLGCGFRPNLKEFVKILLSNQNLTGEIIVNNQKKREANQAAYLMIKELTETHKVPRNRFKLQYRYQAEFGEVELWLNPKKKSH